MYLCYVHELTPKWCPRPHLCPDSRASSNAILNIGNIDHPHDNVCGWQRQRNDERVDSLQHDESCVYVKDGLRCCKLASLEVRLTG